jgi:enoyl-CoA hydratase/carnithine racemase
MVDGNDQAAQIASAGAKRTSAVSLAGTPVEASSDEHLVQGREDAALWLRFNRPHRLNAFSNELYAEIKRTVVQARYDDSVDTIVFTGTGRAFGTGGDLKQTPDMFDNPVQWLEAKEHLPWEAIRNIPKLTIAAVNGICVAGGLVATLLSDISIAAESATFAIPEGRVGIGESYPANLLYGRVSLAKIKYLIYTGRSISAIEAERIGMITEVVPDDKLYDRVREVTAEVRETSAAARRLYKEYINRNIPLIDWEDFLRTFEDAEAKQYLQAFVAKSAAGRRNA